MPAMPAVPLIDSDVDTEEALRTHERHAAEVPWTTTVWNDPVNLMSYVAWVFRRHFGMDAQTAERAMLQVHHEGRAVVAQGNRELMERHAEAMHEYGLQATVERAPA